MTFGQTLTESHFRTILISMSTMTWRERERQEREEAILKAAYDDILTEGYLGLNMSRLAKRVGIANGTLFLHFRTKEDLLLALVSQTAQRFREFFERAEAFKGRPRERMAAVGFADELFSKLYPGHHKLEFLVRADSIWERASEDRRSQFQEKESRCVQVANRIINDALCEGDLELSDMAPEEVTFGLWTISLGAHTLVAASEPLKHAGISNAYRSLRRAQHALLDGINWRPLTHEWDWDDTYRRIRAEVFPEELRIINHA